MSWLASNGRGVILNVRVSPRASRNEVAGEMGDALKIRLQAPPVEGKANRALVEFLADRLDVPRRNIAILSGDSSRAKRILIAGVTESHVRQHLEVVGRPS